MFLSCGAAAAAGMMGGHWIEAAEPAGDGYLEPARRLPIVEQSDVIVCGAGPAGVAAAIAAARAGAKTRLIEVHGCLGGIWTAGLLAWILDATNKSGLMREILAELERRKASAKYGSSVAYDVEQMKRLLEQMCLDAGVKVRLHSRVAAAACDDSQRLKLLVTESKSGREAWGAKVFVDASGDGDLAAQAGCKFDYGREGSGETQPMSLLALLTGIKVDAVAPFVNHLRGESGKKNLLAEMERAGASPSYAGPSLFYLHDDLYCLMSNHEYGMSATNADQISEATIRARAELHKQIEGLRALGDPWKDLQIVATAEQIGVREGRRIHGQYQVSTDDLRSGARHDDAVCRVYFGIDVHSPNPQQTKGIRSEGIKSKPYDIPYRALAARDVKGLLLAGRCISGGFLAHSSYRVTGDAVALGEAAGVAAAVAAASGRPPHEVPWAEIRDRRDALTR
jgi:hypothetical protein